MLGMVGLIVGPRLRLWRRIDGRLVPWTTVTGDEARLRVALGFAQELSRLAVEGGGWAQVFRLGFDAPEPRHLRKVTFRTVPENGLDGRLG